MKTIMILWMVCCVCFTFSAEAQVTPAGPVSCVPVDDWGAPGAVRVAATSEGLRVSWISSPRSPSDVEGFEIVRSTASGGSYSSLAVVHNTVTEFVDSAAAPGVFLWYQVRAFKGGLCSPFSEAVRGMR